jgi:hypothetical protein
MEYENVDYQTRVWPSIRTADGRTLELGPGETADLPDDIDVDDPFLRPVTVEPTGRSVRAPRKPAKAASGAEDAPKSASEGDAA